MPRPRKINLTKLADAMGVTRQAVQSSEILKRDADGEVDIVATLSAAQVQDETYIAAMRKERALADKHEMEAAHRKGELIDVKEAAADRENLCSTIRERMLSLPDRLSPRLAKLDPRQIREILMTEIRKVLQVLSDEVKAA